VNGPTRPPDRHRFRLQPQVLLVSLLRVILQSHEPAGSGNQQIHPKTQKGAKEKSKRTLPSTVNPSKKVPELRRHNDQWLIYVARRKNSSMDLTAQLGQQVTETRGERAQPMDSARAGSNSVRPDRVALVPGAEGFFPQFSLLKLLAWCSLLGAGLLAVASLSAQAAVLNKARGVVIPIYANGYREAVAAIRIDRVAPEHQRLGFFRIRALPLLVIYQARLEVLQPGAASQVISNFCGHLQRLGGSRLVEVRGFQLTLPGEKTPRLEARRVTLQSENQVTGLLLEDATLRESDHEQKIRHAWFGSSPQGPLVRWGAADAAASYDPFSARFLNSQISLKERLSS